MAKNKAKEVGFEHVKNKRASIIGTRDEFKGKDLVNIREFVLNAEEDLVPTKAGFTVPAEQFYDFFKKLRAFGRAEGLLPEKKVVSKKKATTGDDDEKPKKKKGKLELVVDNESKKKKKGSKKDKMVEEIVKKVSKKAKKDADKAVAKAVKKAKGKKGKAAEPVKKRRPKL